MRIGQAAQLVMVVFHRLVIDLASDFDREEVFGDGTVVHDDIGKIDLPSPSSVEMIDPCGSFSTRSPSRL